MQSPFFSPLGTGAADSHSQAKLPQPVMSVPETADLVNVSTALLFDHTQAIIIMLLHKVLKYSEKDLPGILEAVRKEQRNAETEKVW